MTDPFNTADFTWNAVDPAKTKELFVIIWEDGPQPRDARGRFRKRYVKALVPEEQNRGSKDPNHL